MTEYFPTDDYALRTEESSGESLSKNLSGSLSNQTSIQRRKNTFFAMTDIRFESGDSHSRSTTSRRIDDDETRTHLNNDSDNRNLSFNIRLSYRISLSKKSSLSFWVNGDYGTQDRNGWQIDTTASVQGLQVKLRNNGDGRRYGFETSVDYGYKIGENVRFSAAYSFKRSYDRSKMLAVDFLGDPQGALDPRELLQLHERQLFPQPANRPTLQPRRCSGSWLTLTGSVHQVARDERFPEKRRFPRTFYQLNPWFSLTAGKSARRFHLNISSMPQMIPTESLRSSARRHKSPLAAAGNPDLKLPTNLRDQRTLVHTPQEARAFRPFRLRVLVQLLTSRVMPLPR